MPAPLLPYGLAPRATDLGVSTMLTCLVDTLEGDEAALAAQLRTAIANETGADVPEVEVASRPAARGLRRAGHVRCVFPSSAPPAALLASAACIVRRLPVLWGAGGPVFRYTRNARPTAHARMAALAKRFWCVQIQDMTALQWDGLRGMPSVNWLTVVGRNFAAAAGQDIDTLAARATALRADGLFARVQQGCLWVAAGDRPTEGDINQRTAFPAYVRAAELLEPLLLKSHTPLAGPFAREEVLCAWLGRFANPGAWLDCELALP